MILLTLAIYGLFVVAYFVRPGRKTGGALLLATVMLPAALFGALLFDGRIAGDRAIAEFRDSTFDELSMGREFSDIGDGLGERVEVSRSRVGDLETVAYVYDGRFTLIFQNSKLVSKSRTVGKNHTSKFGQ